MKVIRVTREFTLEMAHALWNYDGDCKSIHGHSYRLFVTVSGCPETNDESPKFGMVMDFNELKKIVNEYVISIFDHTVLLYSGVDPSMYRSMGQMLERKLITPYQPTCENLVADFAARIKDKLPEGVTLHSLKLYETSTSYAEWHSSDNE